MDKNTKLKDETVTVETWVFLTQVVQHMRKVADDPKAIHELANRLQEVANSNRK